MKKLILTTVFGLGILAANAGAVNSDSASNQYLYWYVGMSENVFAYAKIACFQEGGEYDYLQIGDTTATAVSAAADERTTESVFSNLGVHDDDSWGNYSFVVEAYDEMGKLVGQSETLAYNDVKGAFYDYEGMMFLGDGVNPMGISVGAIPEPTSGLLFLLGLAGLTLKRKKTVFASFALVGAMCFGAANDTLVSFSTRGPDTYGDGSTVRDGECYALVWTKTGAAFGGFNADGTLVSAEDRLVAVASLAKGGRCPPTLFEIDAKDAVNSAGGSFALYLLDTRVRGADGSVTVGGAGLFAGGATGVSVNAAGAAASGGETLSGGAVALADVGVYAKLAEPKITAMKVEGATVKLTVEGLSETADYFVMQGATPNGVKAQLPTSVEGGVLKVAKPGDGTMFFRVIGARKFK